MGCGQSKIEHEETVTRCKERKLYMKESVSARNAFAAAHSAYVMSLKNTGAALSDYAHGEVLQPPGSKPYSPLLPDSAAPGSSGNAKNIIGAGVVAAAATPDTLPPPPPPLPVDSTSPPPPLQRAASMPEFKVMTKAPMHQETILEEENEEEADADSILKRRRSSHKRSGSSKNAAGGSNKGNMNVDDGDRVVCPPEPNEWDYFFRGIDNMRGATLTEVVEENDVMPPPRRVNDVSDKNMDAADIGAVDKKGMLYEERSSKGGDVDDVEEKVGGEVVVKNAKKGKVVGGGVGGGMMDGRRAGGGGGGMGKILSNANLLQIFTDLDDHFLKASESAHEVSKMLEATRLHYHSNFADNRGHIDHSARVMRVITWNRSFRGLNNPDDAKDDFDSEEHETHATVLDKLLAWEKKLYDEVKAAENMKFVYQRKVAHLNWQKKRSSNSEALEKARAEVSHLHTRYIVDMQSMDSTVSEINRLRDEQLYPKLVALVDGMGMMWETMRVHHESQSQIVYALKALNIPHSLKETSEHHHELTIQLWGIAEGWHLQFEKLVNHQKEYIKSLNSWLKLNLIPIESNLKEKVSSPPRIQSPPIQTLLRAWNDYLGKLPDGHAKSAISNFAATMDTIVQHQKDEMGLKFKCEETRKELSRKTHSFEDWYNKYMQRKKPDEYDPEKVEDGSHDEAVMERRLQVDVVKKRLEEEEEAYRKQCQHVREKSLFSLRSNLPELFRSLSDFSRACSEMYRSLRSISMRRNPEG